MEELRSFLAGVDPGPIEDVAELGSILASCWDSFSGGAAAGMASYKLANRVENAAWHPPHLEFTIERHGATSLNSTRAELQRWNLSMETLSADYHEVGFRQIHKSQKRWDSTLLVKELAALILSGAQDPRLNWRRDGSVTLQIGLILPEESAVQQTLAGRRRRLRNGLQERLNKDGWQMLQPNVFAPTSAEPKVG